MTQRRRDPQREASAPESGRSREAGAAQLAAVIQALHRRGWCDGTGGNFSSVLQREPLRLLMAPSGVDKGAVSAAMLIEVDGAAEVVHGEGRASAETLLHLAIVQGTGAGAVLHTHSQAATLLSQNPAGLLIREEPRSRTEGTDPQDPDGRIVGTPEGSGGVAYLALQDLEMLKGLRGVSSHETVVRVPVLANDQDLRRLSALAAPHLPQAPFGLLIAGHGLYAWGEDLAEARRHVEILEFLLEQRWRRLLIDCICRSRP